MSHPRSCILMTRCDESLMAELLGVRRRILVRASSAFVRKELGSSCVHRDAKNCHSGQR